MNKLNNIPLFLIILSMTVNSCNQMSEETTTRTDTDAPVAEKKDSVIVTHGHSRIDPYFWMRLTDEQKNAEHPDEQTQKVLDYLNSENDYLEKKMKHTE